MLALIILALLVWAWQREAAHRSLKFPPLLHRLLPFSFLILILQIALGAWVSTNYAALACHDYPLCNGEVVPQLDFEHAYTLWRELGRTSSGDFLPFSALITIHWVHRSFAWLVFAVLAGVAWLSRQQAETQGLGNAVFALLLMQFMTGVATIYFSWPLAIAVLHNAGAALLVLILSMLNYRVRSSADLVS